MGVAAAVQRRDAGQRPKGRNMGDQRDDFYQDFRRRIRDWLGRDGRSSKWSEYVMFAPDLLHLLCKLTMDPDIPMREKAKVAASVAYFISPFDLIPEAIAGPGGYVDDIALSAYVLNSIVNTLDQQVVTRHWVGDGDLLQVIQQMLKVADDMVGSGLWRRLKGLAR
jgi:uncharacterized membrane protein YkvA (DUF1232 family)